MRYDKAMIELVFEIRRRVDDEVQPLVRLSNPDLLAQLADHHQHCKDRIVRALINELLVMAEEDGDEVAFKPKKAALTQAHLAGKAQPEKFEPSKTAQRYYRGVRVS